MKSIKNMNLVATSFATLFTVASAVNACTAYRNLNSGTSLKTSSASSTRSVDDLNNPYNFTSDLNIELVLYQNCTVPTSFSGYKTDRQYPSFINLQFAITVDFEMENFDYNAFWLEEKNQQLYCTMQVQSVYYYLGEYQCDYFAGVSSTWSLKGSSEGTFNANNSSKTISKGSFNCVFGWDNWSIHLDVPCYFDDDWNLVIGTVDGSETTSDYLEWWFYTTHCTTVGNWAVQPFKTKTYYPIGSEFQGLTYDSMYVNGYLDSTKEDLWYVIANSNSDYYYDTTFFYEESNYSNYSLNYSCFISSQTSDDVDFSTLTTDYAFDTTSALNPDYLLEMDYDLSYYEEELDYCQVGFKFNEDYFEASLLQWMSLEYTDVDGNAWTSDSDLLDYVAYLPSGAVDLISQAIKDGKLIYDGKTTESYFDDKFGVFTTAPLAKYWNSDHTQSYSLHNFLKTYANSTLEEIQSAINNLSVMNWKTTANMYSDLSTWTKDSWVFTTYKQNWFTLWEDLLADNRQIQISYSWLTTGGISTTNEVYGTLSSLAAGEDIICSCDNWQVNSGSSNPVCLEITDITVGLNTSSGVWFSIDSNYEANCCVVENNEVIIKTPFEMGGWNINEEDIQAFSDSYVIDSVPTAADDDDSFYSGNTGLDTTTLNKFLYSCYPSEVLDWLELGYIPSSSGLSSTDVPFDYNCFFKVKDEFSSEISSLVEILDPSTAFKWNADDGTGTLSCTITCKDKSTKTFDFNVFAINMDEVDCGIWALDEHNTIDTKPSKIDAQYVYDHLIKYADSTENSDNEWLYETNLTKAQFEKAVPADNISITANDDNDSIDIVFNLPEIYYQVNKGQTVSYYSKDTGTIYLDNSSGGSNSLGLALGLGIGIPAAIVVGGVIVFGVKRNKKYKSLASNDEDADNEKMWNKDKKN